jgi:hypothetical protein
MERGRATSARRRGDSRGVDARAGANAYPERSVRSFPEECRPDDSPRATATADGLSPSSSTIIIVNGIIFEFHVERTQTFYRVEFRDHGQYGVEAQFLDPIDLVIRRTFSSASGPDTNAARDGDRQGRRTGEAMERGDSV